MTQEEKDLLIQDICSRLPYKPILVNKNLNGGYPQKCFPGYMGLGKYIDSSKIEDTKILYLRPMSSMTEEEILEYRQHQTNYEFGYFDNYESIDWLNKHHFDYRGLIPMGLAIETPEDLYSNESEYNENGWKDLGNGLKVNRLGHLKLTEKERKKIEDSMYDENGWKDLGNGLKMDKDGHIAGGVKLK